MNRTFMAVLKNWIGEMSFQARESFPDGTPKMGKFETEELYRQGKILLEDPESMIKAGDLSPAQRERLEMLVEEASEVIKACTKILRHGYSSYNPDITDKPVNTNRMDLEYELMDFWTVYERMADYNDINRLDFNSSALRWLKKLKYTHHQPKFHHPTLPRGHHDPRT